MTTLESQLDSNLILQAIAQLRCCTQINIQNGWQSWEAELPAVVASVKDLTANALTNSNSSVPQLNAKGHIAWSRGQVLWLAQRLVVPQDLQGYPLAGLSLRLGLTWWAQSAQIYVNGNLVQEGDLFDCSTRILLSSGVTPGEEIVVTLRLVSPSHDDGALVRSLCIYEYTSDEHLEPGFFADELAVLQKYLDEPEQLSIAAAIAKIDWLALPDKAKFERSLIQARSLLQSFSQNLKQRQIYLLGHAHLDLAWLWSVDETWEAAQRTFASVLKLQQDFPELIFCHSSPALYAWIEQHRPDLFAVIKQYIKAGRWEIVGGLWVEPELNTINGESIVRQLLYGQHYVLEKFGIVSTIAWLPDSFGFCATLPQFLKQGGIEYFVTQKMRWNDTTKFPYDAFWWRSLDGTEIFSLMSAPIGEGIDPVKMASYACEWEKQTSLVESLWLPGVGDHGGGPTRDMLEVARRWQKSPFFPHLEFTTAQTYLQHISTQETGKTGQIAPLQDFKTWNDELYLEFHRGCYTTHADQKLWNRRCERLLYQAELFASLATLSAGVAYPKTQLEAAWKKVLFNQFHDILPGSAIPQVYVDANRDWQEVEQIGEEILQQSLSAIAAQISLPTPPDPEAQAIVVFNPLNWERSQVVEIALLLDKQSYDWRIYNLEGHEIQSQICFLEPKPTPPEDVEPVFTISFIASNIPAIGYRVYWLCSCEPLLKASEPFPQEFVLENECLHIIVDPSTGDLSSVFDKTNQREVLSGSGNQLQAFQDSGQYWDAWNIDPDYAQHPLPPAKLASIQYLERGELRTRIRVIRAIGQSRFREDYILEKDSAVLKIKTNVEWRERHVMVKAAFGVNLAAEYTTYEIPCGAIARPNQPKTPAEQAKWEVPALHWADLSADGYGVSLLNDCKYGYDSQPNQLRLTLLRSPTWPDPDADQGFHEFTYALYPHNSSWQSADTVKRGYELNLPLQVLLLPGSPTGQMSAVGCLLNLSADNLVLMAFKQSEADSQQFILRCYECQGSPAQLFLHSDLGLSVAHSVDLLERAITTADTPSSRHFEIAPWQISSFTVMSATNKNATNS